MHVVVGWTGEEPPVHESAVDVPYHAPDVPLGISLARLSPPALDVGEVPPELRRPPLRVRLVATVDGTAGRYAHVGVGEDEFVDGGVQGEAVRAPA